MRIDTDAGTLRVVLPEDCLIFEVEAHAQLLAEAQWDAVSINQVVVDLGADQSMDTAYFQLVLCIERTARDMNVPCLLENVGSAFRELQELYGLRLSVDQDQANGLNFQEQGEHP